MNLQGNEIWPVGSFRFEKQDHSIENMKLLADEIIRVFDIPCWPELVGLGKEEELIGFWCSLYEQWLNKRKAPEEQSLLLKQALENRIGIKIFLEKFSNQKIELIKGQMIGPRTLLWSLKKRKKIKKDKDLILSFILETFFIQQEILQRISIDSIISLDEPCAFLDKTENIDLWDGFFINCGTTNVALHCCGEPQVEWLGFPWKVIHFDAKELMQAQIKGKDWWEVKKIWQEKWSQFFSRGGVLAAGLVASSRLKIEEESSLVVPLEELKKFFSDINRSKVLISTTCGIDASSISDIQSVMEKLEQTSQQWIVT